MPASGKFDLSNTVVIVGAGFSKAAKIPMADELSKYFLDFQNTPIEQFITKSLRDFWAAVFGYQQAGQEPSFEDHFTLLDLAANAGHNVGRYYTPALLRALRRFSIHRVFEILNREYAESNQIKTFLHTLHAHQGSIISLNWDIVVEKHLEYIGRPFNYGIPGRFIDGGEQQSDAFPLIKLHGSANWHYCDACHSTQFGRTHGKSTLEYNTFLEQTDFIKFPNCERAIEHWNHDKKLLPCPSCGNENTTARVATFSYAKAFDFFPFHASWNAALERLRDARQWVFVGYSLPEADFSFKTLLKTAQLASHPKSIYVVTKSVPDKGTDQRKKSAIGRYDQFFGTTLTEAIPGGFAKWVDDRIA